jgi:curved DNA-binding protein CbpA
MVENDYYRVLGVPENASAEEIKTAYHGLAFKYHPDRNSSAYAEEQMKRINQAHDILSDPDKRVEYDREKKFGPGFSTLGRNPGPRGYTWRKEYTWSWEKQSGTSRTSGRKEWGSYSGGPGSRTSAAGREKAPGWQPRGSNSNPGFLDVILRILGALAAIWIILLRPMLILFLLIIIALLLAFWILIIEILRIVRSKM